MLKPTKENAEQLRRRRERIVIGGLLALIVLFTGVEIHLLRLSSKLPFVNSIFFFGLMNLNIVLIMVMLFLIFRNTIKFILDERRGRIGTRLKTRLIFCFLLFAIIPTILLFSISAFYIKASFDKWSNIKVGGTLQKSIEVVRSYYENSEKNASHFVRKIAYALGDPRRLSADQLQHKIQQGRMEYGLDAVEYYADLLKPRIFSAPPDREPNIPSASLETLQRLFQGNNDCRIQNVGSGELVRCGVFLGAGKGGLFANYFIPIGMASQLSEITLTYEDYRSDNPLNYPIKSAYFAILSMVTLLILFSATWTGFYVARRLTVPLEELAMATQEVAQGNLMYEVPSTGLGDLSKLVESFNKMTRDLRNNKEHLESNQRRLVKMNEELVQRRRLIEVLLENLQSGVISLDEHGRIWLVNPAAGQLLQVPVTEILGKPYWAIIPESHRTEFREILLTVYATSKPMRRELRFRLSSSEEVILMMTLTVLRDEAKKQMGVLAVFDDVTEIQKIQRISAWREVAKRIAHEIKNPLTPISLSVQRLRRRYLNRIEDDGTFDEATQMVLKEVDSLKKMVSEFSSFARLPEVHLKSEDLNEICWEAINLFRTAHEQIQFEISLEEGLPRLQLDRAQIKRVLINLFDNAVAAMDGRGLIAIASRSKKEIGQVDLSVSDEGCGLQEGVEQQLFQPYFSTKEGGTGLGLAIVQRIMADHGGNVRATSHWPKGTCFILEFKETTLVQRREVASTLIEPEVQFPLTQPQNRIDENFFTEKN